ncbi:MAG: hypothetical protein PHG48_04725, partial [Eubacteriales bacterium]|nr:hypothetical protein [Eubacteriales bacterium]
MAANASNGSEGKFSGMPLQQGKGGKRLVFDKLRLEGFGLYRGPAEFRFVPGINIFAAQNESGKTSMVSGLAAVIFGLPHRQGAADTFNLERFRNWDRPAACRGELVFTVFGGGDKNHVGGDGKTYLIERDFDNHQVSLWEIEGEPGGGESPRKKLLLEGQHNPAARKPLEAYDDYLAGMFGIAARELFQETFYITQPLPETRQIGASLQGLLTGGGGRPFHDALEAIAGDLKDITKLTGPNDRGITPRNMGRDGELEKLEDILLKREGEINAGRETADALAGVNRMYNEADSELKAKQKLLEQKNKVLEAWASWQLAAEKYAAASKERENIKRDYDAALELSKKKADILSHIETHYAEFRAADDVEDSLEKIIDLETRVSSLNEKIVGFDNERKSAAEDKERLEGELRLHEKWDGLGPEPVEKLNGLRRDAEIYQEKWNSFITASKRLEELEAALTEKFSLLQDADDRTILMLENFSEERMRLETEKAKANDLNRSAAEAVNEYEQEKALFDKRYGDLAQLPEGASAAAVDKCILLKKKDELQDTIERSKRTPVFKAAAYAGVFLALAGLIVTILMMTGAVTFSTKFKAYSGAALAASTIFTLLMASFTAAAIFKGVRHKRRAQLPLLEEYKKVAAGIKNADLLLGTLADHDGIELARTAERLDRKKEEQDRIGELSKKAAAADLVKLKTDFEKADSHLREFHDSTKIYTEAFPDIKEALKE